MIDALVNIVLLLALLTLLVLVHELGHFVAARRAGVTVHEFGFGFPPRARVLFQRGATTFTLNWLPIGGFVRMEGEERSPAEGTPEATPAEEPQLRPERSDAVESLDPHAFVNQRLRTRLWILFAGVAVNFVLAWFIFSVIAFAAEPTWKVRVNEVMPDSPAEAAGLVGGEFVETRTVEYVDEDGVTQTATIDVFDDSGDLIVAIDGTTFPVFDDLDRAEAAAAGSIGPLEYLRARPAQTVTLTVERSDGTTADLEATLRTQEQIEQDQGALGFTLGAMEFGQQQNGIVDSAVKGLESTVATSTLILRALGSIVVGIFSGTGEGLEDVAGPVGMVSVIGEVRTGLPPVFLLWFVGLISANLAVINLLPIPPLDGSRMLMAVVQRVSGDRVSATTERLVYFTGWVALMVFLVFVTLSDIQRLLR